MLIILLFRYSEVIDQESWFESIVHAGKHVLYSKSQCRYWSRVPGSR